MDKQYIVTKKELLKYIDLAEKKEFEKYVSPFINFLNSAAGSKTGPNKVGQLSVLFNDFINRWHSSKNLKLPNSNDWKKYYLNIDNVFYTNDKICPLSGAEARQQAIKNILTFFDYLKNEIFPKINEDVVTEWVDDLLFQKTYNGLMLEKPVAAYSCKIILKHKNITEKFDLTKLKKASPEQESKGIDYVYELKNGTQLFLQVKTGDVLAGDNLRKTSERFSQLEKDIYACKFNLISDSKDEYNLSISLNNKKI